MTNTTIFNSILAVCVCLIFPCCVPSRVTNTENNKTITRSKISEFRNLMRNQIHPNSSHVHRYINDDLYILRWLQSNKFHVGQSVQSLRKHVAWRHAEKIDSIDLEDWTDFPEDYPQFYNTTDKVGRPIAELWLSVWDVRRAVIKGQGYKLVRWVTHLTEMMQRRLFEIRQQDVNKNVTGAVELLDVEGFNNRVHACPPCYPFYLAVAEISEVQYPYLYESVTMVNVGAIFRQILSSLNQQFGSKRIVSTRIYSTRREWLPVLDREIDKNQRSICFGGTLSRTID